MTREEFLNLKEGDKVVVLNKQGNRGFDIGEIITLKYVFPYTINSSLILGWFSDGSNEGYCINHSQVKKHEQ